MTLILDRCCEMTVADRYYDVNASVVAYFCLWNVKHFFDLCSKVKIVVR
jgi:hypothetical protein